MTPAIAVALDALREAQADAPEELVRLLLDLETHPYSHWSGECISCQAPKDPLTLKDPAHRPACRLAHWLRVFGGQAEVQRQVDAAHEAALSEARPNRITLDGREWHFSDTAASIVEQMQRRQHKERRR